MSLAPCVPAVSAKRRFPPSAAGSRFPAPVPFPTEVVVLVFGLQGERRGTRKYVNRLTQPDGVVLQPVRHWHVTLTKNVSPCF